MLLLCNNNSLNKYQIKLMYYKHISINTEVIASYVIVLMYFEVKLINKINKFITKILKK